MDRMLVVVFNDEAKAYERKRALLQLDNEEPWACNASPEEPRKFQV